MGRLTLNILLSFAQFEREIIGERIRDKIAVRRREGKCAGGADGAGALTTDYVRADSAGPIERRMEAMRARRVNLRALAGRSGANQRRQPVHPSSGEARRRRRRDGRCR